VQRNVAAGNHRPICAGIDMKIAFLNRRNRGYVRNNAFIVSKRIVITGYALGVRVGDLQAAQRHNFRSVGQAVLVYRAVFAKRHRLHGFLYQQFRDDPPR